MIQLQAVSKTFQIGGESFRALGPLDLVIPDGQSVAVVGPSGAGKSTMLSLLGLLDHPTSGTYHLDDIDAGNLSPAQRALVRREQIGFVFQRYNLVEELNVNQNVGLPLVMRGWNARDRSRAVAEALTRVGLEEKGKHRPSQLSGGQQQRVALARAVVGSPKVLLCDEPTGNLDSQTGQQVLDLLLSLHREASDRTLIIVTHNLKIAHDLDRALMISDGLVSGDGVPKDVLPS